MYGDFDNKDDYTREGYVKDGYAEERFSLLRVIKNIL